MDLPAELWEELQRGNIWECSLRDPKWHLDGLSHGEQVYIDPRTSILETLVHELLHRRYRKWGERRVTKEARKMVGAMDERTKARWWRAYRRLVKRGRPIEVE